MGADAVAMLAGFVTSIVVARALGPSGRGIVSLVTVSTVLAAGVASLPLANAIAVEAGRAGRSAATLALAWVGLVGSAGALFWPLVALLANETWQLETGQALALAATGWLVVVASNILRGVLVGEGRFTPVAAGRAVFAAVLLVGNLALAAADGLTAPRSIAVLFGALAMQALVYWRALDYVRRAQLPVGARERTLSYAARAEIGILAQTVLGRLDLILVGALLGVTDAGHYAVALVIAEAGWLAIDGIGLLMLGEAAAGRVEVSRAAWATRTTLALGCAGAAVIAVAAIPLLPLIFGDDFSASYPPLAVMLPGVVAYGAWRVTMADAAGRDRPELQSTSAGFGAPLLLLLCLALVPVAGTAGAAGASSIAYCVTAAVGMTSYAKRFGLPLGDLLVPRQGDLRGVLPVLRRV